MHWMTTEQFAAHVGVFSAETVRRLCRTHPEFSKRCANLVQPGKSRGKWVVREDALDALAGESGGA